MTESSTPTVVRLIQQVRSGDVMTDQGRFR